MMKDRTGIVIAITDSKVENKVADILLDDGEIVSIYLKNANKKHTNYGTMVSELSILKLSLSKKNSIFYFIDDCEVIQHNSIFYKKNLVANLLLGIVSDILVNYKMELVNSSPKTYQLLYTAVILLNVTEETEYQYNILLVLLRELLNELGLLNVSLNCYHCNDSKNIVYFDLNNGGFLCNKCSKKTMNSKLIREYLLLVKMQYKDISKYIFDKQILIQYWESLFDKFYNNEFIASKGREIITLIRELLVE